MIMIMWTTIWSYKRQKNNNFTFVCNNQNNNATSQLPTALLVLSGTTAVSAAPTLSNRILTHQSRNYYQIQAPNAFDPNSDDIKDWIKNFDMFFKINNIPDNRKVIMFLKLDQECMKNVDEYPISENDSQAYQKLKSLLIQLYDSKENSNPKRSFSERRQLENENVHLFVTQLRILSKKAFPGVDQNVTDTFIADQFIDGLKSTEIQIKLKVARPTLNSLSEITELASRYEEVLITTPRTSMHARKINTESNYPIKDQPRNISPDSRHVSFEPTQRCYRCNQTGNIHPNCPQIRPKYDPIPPRALINNLNAPNHQ
ncbi:Transposon Ty3-G Gag-Pol poly [Brachionus plicatilis]|uniref:Transposon Ty3-G Gag-Pol poly n=1 Tax=Brachionus plicatilis TaxID=10195 RepID=A0A3M7S2P3_BRAPC|nr:Transposon Ty3-G Gag-Pol poly [Brachionus plicatilis]